ncbi:putative membrane protein YeiB [Nocardiopsis mwathae]|uniref:Putative membrane protein YeiB n=1 Tax=Nocardiopsis mwathae TaxID=1472723 RepID=A0A7W9YM51_9ACTN|nr:DUF418 domain-containing protein [Nocardiopsis mwathae]MBB6174592.1 putative membrane protein YeiB [Nocardiopsis mwathae]
MSESTERVPRREGVGAGERRLTPDLARGFMLLLIAMAYAPLYLPGAYGSVNTHPDGGTWLDAAVRVVVLLVLDNRSFPMFAALFGYGMVMMLSGQLSRGTPEREARRLLRRRSLFLLLFGAVHAILVFPGEILAAYGLAGLVIGWLLLRPERALLTGAAVTAVIYAVTVPLVGIMMAFATEKSPVVGYSTTADWAERIIFMPLAPVLNNIGFPLLLPLLLGAWAARRRLLDRPGDNKPLLARIAAVGLAISLLGALPAVLVEVGLWNTADPVVLGTVMGVHAYTGVGGGIAYAALFGLLGARLEDAPGPAARALASAGKNSLTCYLMASVLVAVTLHAELLGLGAHLNSAGAIGVAFLCWSVAVLYAVSLDRRGKRGPADVALRRLVYKGAKR